MLPTILGLDHLVVAVRDLDAAAREWAALGFTLSPRGMHSTHMGSANHTMMFGEDYLELLGVLTPQPHNEALRAFLATREGLERAALATTDAEAGAAALRARGLAATGPVHFGRPVPLSEDRVTEARFSVFHWPREEAPGGLRLFACQHHTREAVWLPALQSHPNGVTRITRALVAARDPAGAAASCARLLEGAVRAEGALHLVPTGPGRAEIGFAPRAAIAALGGVDPQRLPEEGGAAIQLATAQPRPPAFASGTLILFESP
ncbi:MAG: VOC family protein [Roseococcus sp.]|nr:VOC family protein [Roseococcus sp.]